MSSPDPTRRVQLIYGFVLLVCVAQTTWWIVDQARFTSDVREQTQAALEAGLPDQLGLSKQWETENHCARIN